MKLQNIEINNFLGIVELSIGVAEPVLFVTGRNGAGKTTIAHALRFVLNDELCRVDLKKDIKGLVRSGERLGSVEITVDGASYSRSAATGHYLGLKPTMPQELTYLLDQTAFFALTQNQRRALLYRIAKVGTTVPEIASTLIQRGHPEKLVRRIEPLLRGGFEPAHAESKNFTAEARGRWVGVTGETYGEVKAETWGDDFGAPDEAAAEWLALAQQKYIEIGEQIGLINIRRGELREQTKRLKDVQGSRAHANLLGTFDVQFAEAQAALEHALAEERTLLDALPCIPPVTGQAPKSQGITQPCPSCGTVLTYSLGFINLWKEDPAPGDNSAEVDAYRKQKWICEQSSKRVGEHHDTVSAVKERVDGARAAKLVVDGFGTEITEESIAAKETQLDELMPRKRQQQVDLRAEIDAAVVRKSDAEKIAQNSKRAREVHEEVKQWAALAKNLAPDGLPAEMLVAALAPFNKILAEHSIDTGWPRVAVTADDIEIAGRHWKLASNSELWRAQAFISMAISKLSGARIIVLDDMDTIVSPDDLAKFMRWIKKNKDESFDNAIVLCAAKEEPKGALSGVHRVWLNGAA